MAIVGISSIHLLKTFIEYGTEETGLTSTEVMWQTIIHFTFVLSAIGLAYIDRYLADQGRRALSGRGLVAAIRGRVRTCPTERRSPATPRQPRKPARVVNSPTCCLRQPRSTALPKAASVRGAPVRLRPDTIWVTEAWVDQDAVKASLEDEENKTLIDRARPDRDMEGDRAAAARRNRGQAGRPRAATPKPGYKLVNVAEVNDRAKTTVSARSRRPLRDR